MTDKRIEAAANAMFFHGWDNEAQRQEEWDDGERSLCHGCDCVELATAALAAADAVDTEKQELIESLKEFVTWADLARESIGLVVENNTNSMVNRAREILAKHGGQS